MVRVRFAPSPTGQVHIGNIRAAIFNWLFARHHGGRFVLRIEDTDRERSTPEAVRAVLGAMAWLGLSHDEEPVYQSHRLASHTAAAEDLVRKGLAYREDKGNTGRGECIVFRMPGEAVSFVDEIKGELRKEPKDLPDFVIVRSDGSPVFHLSNVVDDIQMGITHVIRGDDHVENTFRHIMLYRALGAEPPRFAHLPMIVNEQGKPYSKRDGAAFVGDFREKGYLAEALFNFLALLGWSPGDDREVMTRDEMIAAFDLARVKSSPAKMDLAKLEWMNGEYVRRMPRESFKAVFARELEARGLDPRGAGEAYLDEAARLMQDRVKLFSDVAPDAGFFFTEEFARDDKAVRKRLLKPGVRELLEPVLGQLGGATEPLTAASAEALVRSVAGEDAGTLIHALRVAVSGISKGPGLFEMMALLGRERLARRIERALATMKDVGL